MWLFQKDIFRGWKIYWFGFSIFFIDVFIFSALKGHGKVSCVLVSGCLVSFDNIYRFFVIETALFEVVLFILSVLEGRQSIHWSWSSDTQVVDMNIIDISGLDDFLVENGRALFYDVCLDATVLTRQHILIIKFQLERCSWSFRMQIAGDDFLVVLFQSPGRRVESFAVFQLTNKCSDGTHQTDLAFSLNFVSWGTTRCIHRWGEILNLTMKIEWVACKLVLTDVGWKWHGQSQDHNAGL